jgi:hypothetical protein
MRRRPSRYGARQVLKKYMPRQLHGLIHRASVSTYSTYKGNKQTPIKLTTEQETSISAFIPVSDFWRVVGGKVHEQDVRGLLRQLGLFQ